MSNSEYLNDKEQQLLSGHLDEAYAHILGYVQDSVPKKIWRDAVDSAIRTVNRRHAS